ncbi:MAG: ethanolamine ammonia-lyase subunit EutC [Desulfovibrionaceae bacterium]
MATNDTPDTATTSPHVTPDPWRGLTRFTGARIGLGRCGSSLPLAEVLAFKLAHAQARDAVWLPFDMDAVEAGLAAAGHRCLRLASAVADRGEFLTRPDMGRTLADTSAAILRGEPTGFDLCLVVGDGLSARAIHENAVPFITRFAPLAQAAGLRLAPVCLVANSRVAVADAIAQALGATIVIMCIGERPGLSSPNSMGLYMTYHAAPGTTDEARNCISNVRKGGLGFDEAAQKLAYLVEEALRIKASGVQLKDNMPANHLPFGQATPVLDV